MKKERYKTLFLAMALSSGLALPAARADFLSDADVIANSIEVGDHELATLRGRFVTGGQIAYFGVEMQSQWLLQNGQLLTTQFNLDVDLVDGQSTSPGSKFRPTVTFYASLDNPDTQSQGALNPTYGLAPSSSGGGLENVSGLVQGIQLAGDRNRVNNDLQVSVSKDRISSSATTSGSGVVLTPNSTTVLSDGNGVTAAAILEKNTIGLALAVPGQGTSIQKISGGSGINNLMQLVNISGSQNSINNLTRLNIQVPKAGGAAGSTLGSALQQIRGLR